MPAEVLLAAQHVFTNGVNIASAIAGLAIVAAAVLCLAALQHVPPLGEGQDDEADHR